MPTITYSTTEPQSVSTILTPITNVPTNNVVTSSTTPAPNPTKPLITKAEWDKTGVTVTNVAPGSKQTFTFNYKGTKTIKTLHTSCGCTAAKAENNQVVAILTVDKDFSSVQGQLANMTKTVTVVFMDDTKDTLTVSAVVNKLFAVEK
jgi:hypothetical protein